MEKWAPPSPGSSRPWESLPGVVLSLHLHSWLEIPDAVPASFLLEKWEVAGEVGFALGMGSHGVGSEGKG